MKKIELRAAAGLRNDVPPERFDRDERGNYTGKAELTSAVNCDIDESGKIFRRRGVRRLAHGDMHSLFATPDAAYAVRDGFLCHISPALEFTLLCAVSGRVSAAVAGDAVYWTDGAKCGKVIHGINIPWGLPVPSLPDVAAIPGRLRAGRYLFSMTFVDTTGEESGAAACGEIELSAGQGLAFTRFPCLDAPISAKRIYLSECDGEMLYEAAELAPDCLETSFSELPALQTPIRTQFLSPPLPGSSLVFFSGRLWIASGRFLLYSQPYRYGLFDSHEDALTFPDEIQTLVSLNEGVFISSANKTWWLSHDGKGGFQYRLCGDFGGVRGTSCRLCGEWMNEAGNALEAVGWMSEKGFCAGFSTGEVRNMTGRRFRPAAASEGASLMKFRDGSPQVVTTLFNC